MEILRDQAAIDYLDRAESCLTPEVDNFGSIPLLVKMISLERVFLGRLVAKGQKAFPLPMADYGLPELPAWRTDIVKAFEEVEIIRTNRAQALAPVLQELVNASAAGVDKKFDELQKTLESDSNLLRALEEFSQDEADFLTQRWNTSLSFPFYTAKYAPGLLLSRSDRTPFSEQRGKRKMFNGQSFRPGFKYVDTDLERVREPFFMMVAFSPKPESLGFRIITQGEPLLARSKLIKTNEYATDQPNTRGMDAIIEYYDLSLDKTPQKEGKALKLEKGLQGFRPAIFRALYQTDYTGKHSSLEAYFESLLKLNALAEDVSQFSEQVLGLKPMAADETKQRELKIASELYNIYNAVDDDDLRRVLQIAMAEEMHLTRRETEAAKIRPNNRTNFLPKLKFFREK